MNFEELKEKVEKQETISNKDKYELITYMAIQNILSRFLYKQIDDKTASKELGAVKRAYIGIKHEQDTNKSILHQYQENIKNASEFRYKLNQGLKNNLSDKELLKLAIKCIASLCNDKLLLEKLRKRMEMKQCDPI